MSQEADGSARGFDRLHEYLGHWVGGAFDPRLRGRVEPADLIQEALLRAITHWDQYRGTSDRELRAWLRVILEHTVEDTARRLDVRFRNHGHSLDSVCDGASAPLGDLLSAEESTPSQRVMKLEELAGLNDALARLPEDQRQALVLRHIRGLSVPEVGRIMGRTSAGVAGLLRRGLQRLRELLNESTS